MQNPTPILSLWDRFLSRTCTTEELKQLFHHFGTADERELRRLIQQVMEDEKSLNTVPSKKLDALYRDMRDRRLTLPEADIPRARRTTFYRLWPSYAALFLLALGIGWYVFQAQHADSSISDTQAALNAIMPGGHKATLTWGDGRSIALKEAEEGIIVHSDAVTYSDGTELPDVFQSSSTAKLVLQTPNGGMYQVRLPDGTQVWLNASSSLTYPTQFDADKRIVTLRGEAFFDVAKSKTPFIVETAHQEVEVLGTHFNVRAYPDEPNTRTTLLEGLVQVSRSSDGKRITDPKRLHPGQQSVVSAQGKNIQIHRVDPSASVAWKNGLFNFNHQDLKTVMQEIARWYDIEVAYENGIPPLDFYGKMERNLPLGTVLSMLQKSNLAFRLEGERKLIIINPKSS